MKKKKTFKNESMRLNVYRLKVCSCLQTVYRAQIKSTFYLTKLEFQSGHVGNKFN